LQELYEHRKKREGEILSALGKGLTTISEITASVYADLDKRLITAAKRNVLAHLIDLTTRNICTASKEITTNSRFTLTSKG
jgi:hypothetical protein